MTATVSCVRSLIHASRKVYGRSFSALKFSKEVASALREGKPIVALESTIISHGLPFPDNMEAAKLMEQTVRDHGAVPATIAVINGEPKIGLDSEELLLLANRDGSVRKVSTSDLGFICTNKFTAGTTVASTMKLAHLAGIHVFATGGCGGVHRDVVESMDVSADLIELSRTPVTVVCSGVKSILDIQKTMEMLETFGVPVVGYKCTELPAFFTNKSGVLARMTMQSARDVAQMMQWNQRLSLPSGLLLCVQNPAPADAALVEQAIASALLSAKAEGISGAKTTPYLLKKVVELTGGDSLKSNVALVLNNAKVAAEVAREFSEERKKQ